MPAHVFCNSLSSPATRDPTTNNNKSTMLPEGTRLRTVCAPVQQSPPRPAACCHHRCPVAAPEAAAAAASASGSRRSSAQPGSLRRPCGLQHYCACWFLCMWAQFMRWWKVEACSTAGQSKHLHAGQDLITVHRLLTMHSTMPLPSTHNTQLDPAFPALCAFCNPTTRV